MKEKVILSNGKEYKKPTQRKSQNFADFQVDFIKQFSAFDVMASLKKALENKESQFYKKTWTPEEANIWLIQDVIRNLNFYNHNNN
jgi:hypothetical protein